MTPRKPITATLHEPRHAASFDYLRSMDANARARGYEPRHAECYRCPDIPPGRIDPLEPDPGLCRACLDEVSHKNEARRGVDLGEDGTDGGRFVA